MVNISNRERERERERGVGDLWGAGKWGEAGTGQDRAQLLMTFHSEEMPANISMKFPFFYGEKDY